MWLNADVTHPTRTKPHLPPDDMRHKHVRNVMRHSLPRHFLARRARPTRPAHAPRLRANAMPARPTGK